jgi:AcrR family transcriptional regulator
MRALARASDMKLGALQYHFRTWDELLTALVGYIADSIRESWSQRGLESGSPGVRGGWMILRAFLISLLSCWMKPPVQPRSC